MEVRPSAGKGLGVFALRRIPAGTLVERYEGVFRTCDDQTEVTESFLSSGKYSWTLAEGEWCVDADDPNKSGWARYINHSVRRENCIFVPCGLDALAPPGVLPQATEPFCIFVEALRPIKAGEELLIDYGPEYAWAADDEPPLGTLLRRLKASYL